MAINQNKANNETTRDLHPVLLYSFDRGFQIAGGIVTLSAFFQAFNFGGFNSYKYFVEIC